MLPLLLLPHAALAASCVESPLLQAPSHSSRLDIFSKIIGEEQKRLAAREQLKSMFKGVGDS